MEVWQPARVEPRLQFDMMNNTSVILPLKIAIKELKTFIFVRVIHKYQ
mgnify:CR=1 FL=1